MDKPYNTFTRIVRGYQSNKFNELENAKNRTICTLFKQPLSDQMIYGGLFGVDGDILELFESN